ncbi:hypothetical protein CMI47_20650 [Candidatus Pacearchaeota archaeon]|nr:hypothetical protein [Candidatus Pacearchaeota archaeon]|tara:strand:- start:2447 stop:2791 length:345 start_codon:yes stop_codon:yes gene_type:complete
MQDNEAKVKIKWMSNHCPYEARGTIGEKPFSFSSTNEAWSLNIMKSQLMPNPNCADNIGWQYWGEVDGFVDPGSTFLTRSSVRRLVKDVAYTWFDEDKHSHFRCKYLSGTGNWV